MTGDVGKARGSSRAGHSLVVVGVRLCKPWRRVPGPNDMLRERKADDDIIASNTKLLPC